MSYPSAVLPWGQSLSVALEVTSLSPHHSRSMGQSHRPPHLTVTFALGRTGQTVTLKAGVGVLPAPHKHSPMPVVPRKGNFATSPKGDVNGI